MSAAVTSPEGPEPLRKRVTQTDTPTETTRERSCSPINAIGGIPPSSEIASTTACVTKKLAKRSGLSAADFEAYFKNGTKRRRLSESSSSSSSSGLSLPSVTCKRSHQDADVSSFGKPSDAEDSDGSFSESETPNFAVLPCSPMGGGYDYLTYDEMHDALEILESSYEKVLIVCGGFVKSFLKSKVFPDHGTGESKNDEEASSGDAAARERRWIRVSVTEFTEELKYSVVCLKGAIENFLAVGNDIEKAHAERRRRRKSIEKTVTEPQTVEEDVVKDGESYSRGCASKSPDRDVQPGNTGTSDSDGDAPKKTREVRVGDLPAKAEATSKTLLEKRRKLCAEIFGEEDDDATVASRTELLSPVSDQSSRPPSSIISVTVSGKPSAISGETTDDVPSSADVRESASNSVPPEHGQVERTSRAEDADVDPNRDEAERACEAIGVSTEEPMDVGMGDACGDSSVGSPSGVSELITTLGIEITPDPSEVRDERSALPRPSEIKLQRDVETTNVDGTESAEIRVTGEHAKLLQEPELDSKPSGGRHSSAVECAESPANSLPSSSRIEDPSCSKPVSGEVRGRLTEMFGQKSPSFSGTNGEGGAASSPSLKHEVRGSEELERENNLIPSRATGKVGPSEIDEASRHASGSAAEKIVTVLDDSDLGDDDDVSIVASRVHPVGDFASTSWRLWMLRHRAVQADTAEELNKVRAEGRLCLRQLAAASSVRFPLLEGVALFLNFFTDSAPELVSGCALERERRIQVYWISLMVAAKLNACDWTQSSWTELVGVLGEDAAYFVCLLVAGAGYVSRRSFVWPRRGKTAEAPLEVVSDGVGGYMRRAMPPARFREAWRVWRFFMTAAQRQVPGGLVARASDEAERLLQVVAGEYRDWIAARLRDAGVANCVRTCVHLVLTPPDVDVREDPVYKGIFAFGSGRLVPVELRSAGVLAQNAVKGSDQQVPGDQQPGPCPAPAKPPTIQLAIDEIVETALAGKTPQTRLVDNPIRVKSLQELRALKDATLSVMNNSQTALSSARPQINVVKDSRTQQPIAAVINMPGLPAAAAHQPPGPVPVPEQRPGTVGVDAAARAARLMQNALLSGEASRPQLLQQLLQSASPVAVANSAAPRPLSSEPVPPVLGHAARKSFNQVQQAGIRLGGVQQQQQPGASKDGNPLLARLLQNGAREQQQQQRHLQRHQPVVAQPLPQMSPPQFQQYPTQNVGCSRAEQAYAAPVASHMQNGTYVGQRQQQQLQLPQQQQPQPPNLGASYAAQQQATAVGRYGYLAIQPTSRAHSGVLGGGPQGRQQGPSGDQNYQIPAVDVDVSRLGEALRRTTPSDGFAPPNVTVGPGQSSPPVSATALPSNEKLSRLPRLEPLAGPSSSSASVAGVQMAQTRKSVTPPSLLESMLTNPGSERSTPSSTAAVVNGVQEPPAVPAAPLQLQGQVFISPRSIPIVSVEDDQRNRDQVNLVSSATMGGAVKGERGCQSLLPGLPSDADENEDQGRDQEQPSTTTLDMKVDEVEGYVCAVCGRAAEFACDCEEVCYCSGECQLKHWNEKHGEDCKKASYE